MRDLYKAAASRSESCSNTWDCIFALPDCLQGSAEVVVLMCAGRAASGHQGSRKRCARDGPEKKIEVG